MLTHKFKTVRHSCQMSFFFISFFLEGRGVGGVNALWYLLNDHSISAGVKSRVSLFLNCFTSYSFKLNHLLPKYTNLVTAIVLFLKFPHSSLSICHISNPCAAAEVEMFPELDFPSRCPCTDTVGGWASSRKATLQNGLHF